MREIKSEFKEGKMSTILEKWGMKDATTTQLLQILNKINRKDLIDDLQKQFPSIKKYFDDSISTN